MSVLCRVEWNNARCNMELAMALGDDIQWSNNKKCTLAINPMCNPAAIRPCTVAADNPRRSVKRHGRSDCFSLSSGHENPMHPHAHQACMRSPGTHIQPCAMCLSWKAVPQWPGKHKVLYLHMLLCVYGVSAYLGIIVRKKILKELKHEAPLHQG